MKWKYNEIVKLKQRDQVARLSHEKRKPFNIYLCTSPNTNVSKGDLCLLSDIIHDKPLTINEKKIIVLKSKNDDDEAVNKCLEILMNDSEIRTFFKKAEVLILSQDSIQQNHFLREAVVIAVVTIIIAALILIIRRRHISSIQDKFKT